MNNTKHGTGVPDQSFFSPIAIVSAGCVFAGSPNLESLWQLVASGQKVLVLQNSGILGQTLPLQFICPQDRASESLKPISLSRVFISSMPQASFWFGLRNPTTLCFQKR
jgi:hypothetical protein